MVLLLDGNFLSYRARFTVGHLEHGTMFGFLRQIKSIVKKFEQEFFVCWDSGLSPYRCDLYGIYKAKEGPRKPPLYETDEFEALHDFIKALGGWSIPMPFRAEADDVIGVLCNEDSIIVSSDSDFQQIGVLIWNPIKKKFIEPIGRDIILIKALVGDGSDNIHGIHGVGTKTAEKIIKHYKEFLELPEKYYEHTTLFLKNIELVTIPRNLQSFTKYYGPVEADILRRTIKFTAENHNNNNPSRWNTLAVRWGMEALVVKR